MTNKPDKEKQDTKKPENPFLKKNQFPLSSKLLNSPSLKKDINNKSSIVVSSKDSISTKFLNLVKTNGAESHPSVFLESQKVSWLKLYKEYPRNISKCCELIGISRTTFSIHYDRDEAFRGAVDSINDSFLDTLEQGMIERGTKGKFLESLVSLKTLRPNPWNPDRNIRVSFNIDQGQAKERLENLKQVIDAEEVGGGEPNPQDPNG